MPELGACASSGRACRSGQLGPPGRRGRATGRSHFPGCSSESAVSTGVGSAASDHAGSEGELSFQQKMEAQFGKDVFKYLVITTGVLCYPLMGYGVAMKAAARAAEAAGGM